MNLKRIQLTLNNLDFFQEKINEIDINYHISATNFFYCWDQVDYKISFVLDVDAIYIYCLHFDAKKNKQELFIVRPVIKDESKALFYIKKSLAIASKFYDINQGVSFVRMSESDLALFKNCKISQPLDAAFFYPTDQLKYMAGKKMQKRRNFLNFFIKNYESKTKLFKYNQHYYDVVVKYCKKHIEESDPNNFREMEFTSLKAFLKNDSKNAFGTVMYYEGKIIGVTFGFVINNKYEIFLEKADRNFKGSYQYLLSSNLKLNNINTEIVDRQDSAWEDGLVSSKKAYKPSKIIKTYNIEWNQNEINRH